MSNFVIAEDSPVIYRIRFKGDDGHRRYRHFFSRERALKHALWWMIWSRYGNYMLDDPFGLEGRLIGRPKCACHRQEHAPDWQDCPRHDREDGYFARLHQRLTRLANKGLLSSYTFQSFNTTEDQETGLKEALLAALESLKHDDGWLTPRMASIAGMYEDGEGIQEELERLDESLVHLGHIAWDAWAALDHDRWEELAGDLFDILKKLELKAQEGEPVLF